MTVSYSLAVSTSRLCTFGKLLRRWRGSVYQIIWREISLFLILYCVLNMCYRFLMDEDQQRYFERVCRHCTRYTDKVPLTFILGFYVSIVFKRWWEQFEAVTWPDRMALYISTYIRGSDSSARLVRRTMIRYLNLASLLGLRMVSSAIMKRFPTMAHLVESGFMTMNELKMFESVGTRYSKEFVPLQWCATLLHRARAENRIENDRVLLELMKEVNDFRDRIRRMCFFDWLSIPLVYTQVVAIAVYTFFLASLMASQSLIGTAASDITIYTQASPALQNEIGPNVTHSHTITIGYPLPYANDSNTIPYLFPLFTVLQIMFYVGWLKVAEVLINPFGEDPDDFEVNFIVERNLEISYVLADEMYDQAPKLEPDAYWPYTSITIPHTAASYGLQDHPFYGSAAQIKVAAPEAEIVVECIDEEDENPQPDLSDTISKHAMSHKRSIASLTRGGDERRRSSLADDPAEAFRRIARQLTSSDAHRFTTRPLSVSISSTSSQNSTQLLVPNSKFSRSQRRPRLNSAGAASVDLPFISVDSQPHTRENSLGDMASEYGLQTDETTALLKTQDNAVGEVSPQANCAPLKMLAKLETIVEDAKSTNSTLHKDEEAKPRIQDLKFHKDDN